MKGVKIQTTSGEWGISGNSLNRTWVDVSTNDEQRTTL